MSVATARARSRRSCATSPGSSGARWECPAPPPSRSGTASGRPEALLLFSLEVGRHDPRLFDEVLDWLALNESLISVQRLRNLCVDDLDRALVEVRLGLGRPGGSRACDSRASRVSAATAKTTLRRPLGARGPLTSRRSRASGSSVRTSNPPASRRAPDYSAPINLAFRLRRLLGIGARAEVSRVLLTSDAPSVTTGVVHAAAGFARPNVREALAQLQDAGVAESRGRGSDAALRDSPRGLGTTASDPRTTRSLDIRTGSRHSVRCDSCCAGSTTITRKPSRTTCSPARRGS